MRIYLLLAIAAAASFIGSNCGGGGVGDPCVPEDEYLTTFSGFSVGEVNVESRSFQCLTRVCLVNHFRGRVSCPYGQAEDDYGGRIEESGRSICAGTDVAGTPAADNFDCPPNGPCYVCGSDNNGDGVPDDVGSGSLCDDPSCLPGGAEHARTCRVPGRDGTKIEDRIQVPVDPQIQERTSEDTVYCSCRCAPPPGAEDTNARFCECPSNYECLPLVDDLDLGKAQLAGSYCVKQETEFDPKNLYTDCQSGTGTCGNQVEAVVDGQIVEQGRNPGTSCYESGTVCTGDTWCCDGFSPDNSPGAGPFDRQVQRSHCDNVGVQRTVNNRTVTVCP